MPIEWVKDTPYREIKVNFPEHWYEFLKEEAKYMNEKTGTKNYTPKTVIYQAVKRFAYQRGFIQIGGNKNGVVVRRDADE